MHTLRRLTEKHQKTIAKIVEIIKNSVGADLVSIIIFGSFVRGEFTEKSDYDVLIVISDYEDVKSRGFCFLQFAFCNYIMLCHRSLQQYIACLRVDYFNGIASIKRKTRDLQFVSHCKLRIPVRPGIPVSIAI